MKLLFFAILSLASASHLRKLPKDACHKVICVEEGVTCEIDANGNPTCPSAPTPPPPAGCVECEISGLVCDVYGGVFLGCIDPHGQCFVNPCRNPKEDCVEVGLTGYYCVKN